MPSTKNSLVPIHPGEILLEEFLRPNGINPHRLSLALRVPQNRISQIIDGRRAITADTALRLGRYFGIDAEFWLRLQASYDIRIARMQHQVEIDRDVQPLET